MDFLFYFLFKLIIQSTFPFGCVIVGKYQVIADDVYLLYTLPQKNHNKTVKNLSMGCK